MPGASSTTVVSASEAISTSACPTPTVSTSTTSQPAASSTRIACGVAHDSPPRCPRDGHRADVDARVGGVVLHPHPVAEQRAAGERRGRVDREHADPLVPAAVRRRPAPTVVVDLPTPGEPVSPITCGVPGVRRERRHDLAQLRRGVLDQGDQPGDAAMVALARPGDEVPADVDAADGRDVSGLTPTC